MESMDKFQMRAVSMLDERPRAKGLRSDAGNRMRSAIAMAGIAGVSGRSWRGGWWKPASAS